MRILVVEPDPAISQIIELVLRGETMSPWVATEGEEAIELAKIYDYDLMTLELALPDMCGLDVIGQLRRSACKVPILVLTGVRGVPFIVRALGLGADDYLTKPFHAREMIARIHAIVRRAQGYAENVIDLGAGLVLSLDSREVYFREREVRLTGREYAVLEALALRKGRAMTQADLLTRVYDGQDEPEAKTIDVYICKLRRKLAQASGGLKFIETLWGRGFMLRDPYPALIAA